MRFSIMVLLAMGLAGCSDGEKKINEPEYIIGDSILAWEVNSDSMIMTRDSTIPDSAITITRIINGLNQKYPEVRINFLKQNNDTVYTEVPDAEYLGEQMGSAGATNWFADAVVNLTSIAGINYVSFKMDTHSHASAAVIDRTKYSDWKKE
jgi:hypothetical protein